MLSEDERIETTDTASPLRPLIVQSGGWHDRTLSLKTRSAAHTYVLLPTVSFDSCFCLVPTPDATALRATKALLCWVCLFGAPYRLLPDIGIQFIDHTIDELLKLMHASKPDILKDILERRNEEVNSLFKTEVKDMWSEALPLARPTNDQHSVRSLQALLLHKSSLAVLQICLDSEILLASPSDEHQSKRLS